MPILAVAHKVKSNTATDFTRSSSAPAFSGLYQALQARELGLQVRVFESAPARRTGIGTAIPAPLIRKLDLRYSFPRNC